MAAERITKHSFIEGINELRTFLVRQQPANYTPEQHQRWVDSRCTPGIRKGSYRAYVWRQQAQVVGDAVVRLGDGQSTLVIRNLYIARHMRGQGLGSALLGQVLDDARSFLRDCKAVAAHADEICIRTDVPAGSISEVFFEKRGFTEIEVTSLYAPGKFDVIMERSIAYERHNSH